MSFKVTANRDQNYVHLVYSGEVDLEQRLEARDMAFSVRKQHDFNRTLVETQDSNMRMSARDIIQFAKSFPADLPASYHVAVVVGPNNDVDTLLENLASSSGLAIRAFKDRDAALKWMLAF